MISNNTFNIIIILLMISLGFFIISGFIFKGSLNSPATLTNEILSPAEALYEYNITDQEPFKFRILFSSLVKITYDIFSEPQNNQNFYRIYVFWSGFFYISAALSFYWLLMVVGFHRSYAFIGTMLFLISPAIIYAFSLPVHTREDMLAYTILNIGLICIFKNNYIGILILTILGVLCRETLLLLPLMFLLYGSASITYRTGVFLLGCAVFFVIRTVLGNEGYDPIGLGLMYNLENKLEVVGFSFLVFSYMWPVLFLDIYYINTRAKKTHDRSPITLLRKSSLLVLVLVFAATIIGGRVNEIRLLFILFPWIIVIFLFYLEHEIRPLIKNAITNEYKIYAILISIPCIVLYIVAYYNIHLFLEGVHDVPYVQWITITCIYLYVFFLFVPLYLSLTKRKLPSTYKETST